VLTLLVVMAGCRYGGTFLCDTNEECGIGGSCQATTHYCSFTDTKCVSGQRYDETAGSYGGVCVGEENGIDAAVFDPTTCPATYNVMIASSSSRYFVRTATTSFWMHHAGCKTDLTGATHLMLPDSTTEISEVVAATMNMAVGSNEFFVGAAQNIAAATAANTGWTRVDGNALDPSFWMPNEPNDGDGNEANHAENIASINRSAAMLNDTVGATATSPAICECDGKAVPPSVDSILAGDPNHD
jgi:hypothetical protein